MSIEQGPRLPRDEIVGSADTNLRELWEVFGGVEAETPVEITESGHPEYSSPRIPDTSDDTVRITPELGQPSLATTTEGTPIIDTTKHIPLPAIYHTEADRRVGFLGTRGQKVAATVGLVAAAGVAGFFTWLRGPLAAEHEPHGSPAAAATATPNALQSNNANIPHDIMHGYLPDQVSGLVSPTGNFKLNADYPYTQTRTLPWGNTTVKLPAPVWPDTVVGDGNTKIQYTVQDATNMIMANLAELYSLPTEDPKFKALLGALTTEPDVQKLIRDQAQALQQKYGPDVQFMLFDTGDSPVTPEIKIGLATDKNGGQPQTIDANAGGGWWYIRAIRTGAKGEDGQPLTFDDPRAYATGQAVPVTYVIALGDAPDDGSGVPYINIIGMKTAVRTSGGNDSFAVAAPITGKTYNMY